ncbi:MAG: hypothetical protein ACRYFZ_05235 [Janthinobacterium lividum]
MRQYFNLKRLGRLLRKQLTDYYINYLLGLGVLLGGLLLLIGGFVYWEYRIFPVRTQEGFFVMLLLATGSFFTSTVFAALGDKRQAATLLTLPASQLEKYLAGWLLSLVGFTLVYLVAFYTVDVLLLQLLRLRGGLPHTLFNIFSPQSPVLAWLLVYYPLLHAVMLYGSIFFQKSQFVRTAALSLLAVLVLCLANWQALSVLFHRQVGLAFPFGEVSVHDNELSYYVAYTSLPAGQLPWLDALPLVLAVMLWVAAYFRLAEKQL